MTSIIDRIKAKQSNQPVLDLHPPRHRPEMLYIGCIDARLDPVADIGIPQGKALIYRNIAALVRPAQGHGGSIDGEAAVASGEIPESVSIGAALEFFLVHIEMPPSGVKHIVVSGHTDCGGIRACVQGVPGDYLPRYLTALSAVREHVLANPAHTTEAQRCDAMEEAAVRQSIENLKSYDVVRKALETGKVELHGWIINTATQRILEMDAEGIFQPLG
jgi:carbonic anhydrase